MPDLTTLIAALDKNDRTWWLAAMRQDACIWNALLASPVTETLPVTSWSPATLALAALQQPLELVSLRQLLPISSRLRLRAGRAFEHHTKPRSAFTPTIQTDLAEAGLLALALRERRRLIGNWEGLTSELRLADLNSWRTPLACLLGMIPNPQEMLAALIADGQQPAWNALALHTLLSNPLPPDEQADWLKAILPANPLPLFNQLASLRPQLARRLAALQTTGLDEAAAAQLATLAGDPQAALNHLARATQTLHHAQAQLDAQTAAVMAHFSPANRVTAQTLWRQAIERDPNQPEYWICLVHALLDDNKTIEAANLLQAGIAHQDHPEMRFALARLAYQSGDAERARHLAIQALQTFEQAAPATRGFNAPSSTTPHAQYPSQRLMALGTFLLELGRPRLAAQAAELALQHNPAHADLLALLAKAHFADDHPDEGLKAMRLATLFAPEDHSLRRQYASHLENQAQWQAALCERQTIAADLPECPADWYALAACGMQAKQPHITIEACQHALSIQAEDGPLHDLLAEALLQIGDENTACEHFNAATLLAPGLPRPWLALAKIFQKRGESQQALETLRAAAQAAPQSAEIHLNLGEAYLAANAPTSALEALKQAAQLAPHLPSLTLPLAQALHRLGYLHEARHVIEASPWQEQASPHLAYTYAQVLLALGELSNALPALQRVVAMQPEDASPYLDYACTLLTLRQDLPQAVEALRHVISIAPHQIIAQAFLAEALEASGDVPAALEAYQLALESDLGRDALWRGRLSLGLGQAALSLQQTDTAIAALHEASQADPDNVQIYHALADAYQLAGLQQNALQAMRAVLHYNPDQLDELLWFAEKALELANHSEKSETRSQPIAQTARLEAAQVLRQAIALAPRRADLRLQLSSCLLAQSERTYHTEGREVLILLLELPEASAADLQQAAHLLLNPLGDPASAIACLEGALGKAASEQVCDLLNDLAHAHRQFGNLAAALESIERALALQGARPDVRAELRRAKAHLLVDLEQPQDALDWAESVLQTQPDDADLHYLAAQLRQEQGHLEATLGHVEPILATQPRLRLHAAELARALLQFERAIGYLAAIPPDDARLAMEASLLRAELSLEINAEIAAAEAFTSAIEKAPIESISQPDLRGRILALQARLTLRRGDLPAALDLYQQASEGIQPEQPANARYAFAAAALDLEDWETSLQTARQNITCNPHEAYASFHLVRVMVRRAEAQRLCEAAHCLAHMPGQTATATSARREFERAVKAARQCVKESADQRLALLDAWEKRGNMAFQRSGKDAPAEQPYQVIAALLAQAEDGPEQATAALAAAQSFCRGALQASQPNQAAHPAILHYLLACTSLLAHALPGAEEAIQVALALWPDEPRWQALAAEISLANGDALRAIERAEQAQRLEPMNAGHQVLLGQSLLKLRPQHINPAEIERRARMAFEQATRLDANLPEAWYALAHCQLNAGDLNAASVSAEQAINLAPEQVDYLLLRGQIALHSHQPEEALQHAQAALNLQPERHTGLLLAARALQALDRPDEALALLDQAPTITQRAAAPATPAPNTIESHTAEKPLALQLERLRAITHTHGSQAALQTAIALAETHPDNLEVLSAVAHLQAENGERDAALRTAQQAVQIGKSTNNQRELEAGLHHLMGELQRRAGQLDQAVHHLSQAARLDPQRLETYLELGQAQQERRLYRQALATFQQAIALAPHDPRPYLQAGLALKDGKSYLDSERMLRRAAELAPKDVTIRRQLAAVVALNLVHNRRENVPHETDHITANENA